MSDSVQFVLLISSIIFFVISIAMFMALRKRDVLIEQLKNQYSDDEKLRAENHVMRRENDAFKEANEELKSKVVELSSRMLLLSNVANSLGASLDPKDIFNSVVNVTEKLLDAKSASVLTLDRTGQYLSPKVARGWKRDQALSLKIEPGKGIIGWVMKNRSLMTEEDISGDYKLSDLKKQSQIASVMCAPIAAHEDGEINGVLNVEEIKGKLTNEHKRLFTILSNMTSMSLRNAYLFKKTEMMANVDGLTKLYNNRYFQQFLDEELKRSQRYRHKVSVVMTDIDHFKNFNDRYGHPIGDLVLEETARVFKKCTRHKIDLVARYGGEEFIAVLPETDIEGSEIFAERLRSAVEGTVCINPDTGEKLSITISVGAATFPDHTTERDMLVRMADDALLKAKNTGRNKVVIADIPPAE